MADEGRILAIADLIRGHGPRAAAEIVREANEKHREMNPGGCDTRPCRVCGSSPRNQDTKEAE